MKRFSLLLLLLTFVGFVACEPDEVPDVSPTLVLSSDVDTITADGLSVATFVVKRDGKIVTDECVIYNVESGEPLSGAIFTSTEKGVYSFYAVCAAEKSNTIEIEVLAEGEVPAEKTAVLSVSKEEIVSDGVDAATFVVKVDGEDVTDSAAIYMEGSDQPIEGNSFTTTTEGTYTFFATVDGAKRSNSVTIVATAAPLIEEKPIELTASTQSIYANGVDTVIFTVKQEDKIVTDDCTIYVDGSVLNGNRFSTYAPGTYTFHAVKGNVTSNEVVVTVEPSADTGKTIVFADGVGPNSGWYDVNKKARGDNGDTNMCWAAAASNMIQWWQDRYVAAGHTLPATAVTGPGTKNYEGWGTYELALMDIFWNEWDNKVGGHTEQAIPWYFEGTINEGALASVGSQAVPLTPGGFWKNEWSSIYDHLYHEYTAIVVPGIAEYLGQYTNCFTSACGWDDQFSYHKAVTGMDAYVKFSQRVREFIDRGICSLTVTASATGGVMHATTIWGYEVDNSTGLVTRLWITDSDDLETEPKQQLLNEYNISAAEGSKFVKMEGDTRYGVIYAVDIRPFSGYGSNQ